MPIDIRKPLKKFLPYLLRAREENLNEADTVRHLLKVFEEVLEYDALTEITSEAQIKEKYVDIALKLDGVIRLLVEAKSAGTALRDRHVEQAQRYAAESNIRWVLLTNGVNWNLYHLTFEEGIEYERVFVVDLAEDQLDKAACLLSLLHRQSIRTGDHEKFWQSRAALSPQSIAEVVFREDFLRLIRREIRKREGVLIDPEDLARALHEMLSTEARELIGPPKIRRKKKPKVPSARVKPTSPTEMAEEAPGGDQAE